MKRFALSLALVLFAFSVSVRQADAKLTADMKEGKAELKSVGPLAFGPEGILFIADTKAAAIVAVATGDTKTAAAKPFKVEAINQKIAALLGTSADQILIEDLAGNNIGKPFEVDLFEGVQRQLTSSSVKLPFEVR